MELRMRAREFITEQSKLPPEIADPMSHTYVLPGLSASDPYGIYRFGVAMARARSDTGQDAAEADKYMPAWQTETAFGEHGVVAGFDANIDPIIDKALAMTQTPGGKHLVSTTLSQEPKSVETVSPVKPFRGYKR
jgi:hypothetical protein